MEENPRKAKNVLEQIADACGGKIESVTGPLPDGSGFAIMSMPLPKDHWIYQYDVTEGGPFNVPPMPFRMGANEKATIAFFPQQPPPAMRRDAPGPSYINMTKREFAERIRAAGKYAVRCSTMNGKEMDFDPDALLQNLVTGFLGYNTEDGLSEDEWANPKIQGGDDGAV